MREQAAYVLRELRYLPNQFTAARLVLVVVLCVAQYAFLVDVFVAQSTASLAAQGPALHSDAGPHRLAA